MNFMLRLREGDISFQENTS